MKFVFWLAVRDIGLLGALLFNPWIIRRGPINVAGTGMSGHAIIRGHRRIILKWTGIAAQFNN
jgi:hypothetical protein